MSQADIIVNLADESITDLDNAVWVKDWEQAGDLDNDDAVSYAAQHGKSLAALVDFVRAVANFSTTKEVVSELDDPTDPDRVLEAVQGVQYDSAGTFDSLIGWARNLA